MHWQTALEHSFNEKKKNKKVFYYPQNKTLGFEKI